MWHTVTPRLLLFNKNIPPINSKKIVNTPFEGKDPIKYTRKENAPIMADFDDDDIYSGLKSVKAHIWNNASTPAPAKSAFDSNTPAVVSSDTSNNNDHSVTTNDTPALGISYNPILQQSLGAAQPPNKGDTSQHTAEYAATICRAWKLGKCERGDSCRFNHDSAYFNTETWSPPNVHSKLFVGGIPFEADDEEIKKGFGINGDKIADISIVRDKVTGKSRGFGFVTFKSEEDVETVLNSKVFVLERQVDMRIAVPRGQDAPVPENRRTFKDSDDADVVSHKGGGAGRRREEPEDWRKKVFVGGVPQEVDNAAVKEYFSKYSKETEVNLMYDRVTGRSRGFGFIIFPSAEIVQQVLLERHKLGGKDVEIKRAVPKGQMQNQRPGHSNAFQHYGPGERRRDGKRGGGGGGGKWNSRGDGPNNGGVGGGESYGSAYGSRGDRPHGGGGGWSSGSSSNYPNSRGGGGGWNSGRTDGRDGGYHHQSHQQHQHGGWNSGGGVMENRAGRGRGGYGNAYGLGGGGGGWNSGGGDVSRQFPPSYPSYPHDKGPIEREVAQDRRRDRSRSRSRSRE